MKKVLILSAAAILGISSIAVSQAEEVTNDAAASTTEVSEASADEATTDAESTDDASASEEEPVDADGSEEQVETAQIDEAESAPVDSPQVQKLIALYPQLVSRIEPYGKVCFQGEDCDVTVTATGPSADGKPRDGKAVYDAICHTCHAAGLLGAPKYGDAGAWGPRIAQGKATLYDHAIHGIGAMPAKGGADIPDEEVENAVNYMVEAAS
ncbi:c-type cytochrome [Psychrobacter sp. I-STPA6b]|uniref:c-type cytochrome n=1 Tax=Psychrobacter sp. I-STPA6b TaxID=2585718 RepID=UPI001D0CC3D1|nr:c-type cytochrome [Psychrobacter sp. I-STPA6b]